MTGSGLLEGRVTVVTGAGRGIGAAIAGRFAAQGASVVVVVDVDEKLARKTSEAIAAQTGAVVVPEQLDVTNESSVETAADTWIDRFGRLDCVVANAGILHLADVVDFPLDSWRRVLDVNLTGAFVTARAAARRMIGANRGSIVFTSSLFGVRGGRENAAYSASKFGVVGLAQCLAAELAAANIRVNSVCPGQVATDMIEKLLVDRAALTGQSRDQVLANLVSHVPMGRMATVDEIADLFVFLASDLSSYVTGQALVVDGGWQVG